VFANLERLISNGSRAQSIDYSSVISDGMRVEVEVLVDLSYTL
jgi:hypothetical protein